MTFSTVPFTITDEDVFLTCLNEGVYIEGHGRIGYLADSVYDLTRAMGKTTSATTSQQVMTSLRVMASAPVEVTTYSISFSGTLADVVMTEPNAPVKVAFNPALSQLMKVSENSSEPNRGTLRHINMGMRDELCHTGKAIMRFIYGHGAKKLYKFSLAKLREATAPHMRTDNFRDVVKRTLLKLKHMQFLSYGEIKAEMGEEWVLYRRTVQKERGQE